MRCVSLVYCAVYRGSVFPRTSANSRQTGSCSSSGTVEPSRSLARYSTLCTNFSVEVHQMPQSADFLAFYLFSLLFWILLVFFFRTISEKRRFFVLFSDFSSLPTELIVLSLCFDWNVISTNHYAAFVTHTIRFEIFSTQCNDANIRVNWFIAEILRSNKRTVKVFLLFLHTIYMKISRSKFQTRTTNCFSILFPFQLDYSAFAENSHQKYSEFYWII